MRKAKAIDNARHVSPSGRGWIRLLDTKELAPTLGWLHRRAKLADMQFGEGLPPATVPGEMLDDVEITKDDFFVWLQLSTELSVCDAQKMGKHYDLPRLLAHGPDDRVQSHQERAS